MYEAQNRKPIKIGAGEISFIINQEQKGGFSLFGNRKMPSMFGGKGYECPEDRELISMITWKT